MPRHRTCAVLTCKLDPDPRCKGYCFKHRLDRRPLLQIFGVQKRPPPTVHRRTKSSGKQWSSMLRSPTPTGRQLHYEYKRNSSPRRKQRSSSRESSSGSGSGRRRSSGSRKYVSTRSKSEVRGRRNGTRGQHQQQPKRSSNHETKGGSRRRGRSRGNQMLIEVGKRPKRSNRSRSAVAQRSGQRGRRGRRTEERKQTRRISPPPSPPISPVAVYSSDEEVDVPSPPPWPPGGVRFSKYESEHRLFHIEDEPEKIQNATPIIVEPYRVEKKVVAAKIDRTKKKKKRGFLRSLFFGKSKQKVIDEPEPEQIPKVKKGSISAPVSPKAAHLSAPPPIRGWYAQPASLPPKS